VRACGTRPSLNVMPGLDPGIHAFLSFWTKDMDGRDKPGHDENREVARSVRKIPAARYFLMA
jgi:hypothetical protein